MSMHSERGNGSKAEMAKESTENLKNELVQIRLTPQAVEPALAETGSTTPKLGEFLRARLRV